MNSIRQIQELNKRELENGVSPEASWHTDYRDTAYIYIGGLPYELSEGDIITIFSQFGEPTFVNLIRDKETGKSKGFAFLKYEDQRSTDLAVDNLGGTKIMNRTLRVDHTRYKKKDDDDEATAMPNIGDSGDPASLSPGRESHRRTLPEEQQLRSPIDGHDDEDPMKDYLIEEKRREVAAAPTGSKNRHRHSRHSERRHDRSARHSRSRSLERRRRRQSRSPERRHRRHSRSRSPERRRRSSRSQSPERRHHHSRRSDGREDAVRSRRHESRERRSG